MHQIAPTFHNHCPIYVILTFIPQVSIFQVKNEKWKLDDQFLVVQAKIDTNRKAYVEKTKKCNSKLDKLAEMVKKMMN